MKPTVTQLIKILDKPALMHWANKIGLQGTSLQAYWKSATKTGNDFHNQVSEHLINQTPIESATLRMGLERFLYGAEVLGVEENIETDYFVGRYDVRFKKDGLIYLCDWKTGAKRLYLENQLQLAAYAMAVEADILAVVSLPDFKQYHVRKDLKPHQEILKALSIIYHNKELIENPPTP